MCWPHQQEAVEAVVHHFKQCGERRATVVMPGGAGKTLVGARVLSAMVAGSSMGVLVTPTLALISQAVREYERCVPGLMASAIVVASRSVGPLRRSTRAHALSNWVSESNTKLAISTYASLPRLAEAIALVGREVEVAVLDEAHVTTYASHSKRSSGYVTAVDEKTFPVRHRLFMTATPRVVVGEDNVGRSMDDIALYGQMVREMTSDEASKLGVTVPLTVVVVDADSTEVSNDKKKRRDATLADVEVAVAVRRVYEEHGANRAFCFLNSNRRARQFESTARAVWADAGIAAKRVDGRMSPAEREAVLAEVRSNASEKQVVANSRLLGTGVDAPLVDAVVVAEPRRSHVDVAQMMARAARSAPSKKRGLVIVPVRIDMSSKDGVDTAIATDDFGTVVAVLRALAADEGALNEGWRAAARRTTVADSASSFADEINRSGALGEHRILVDARIPRIKALLEKTLRTATLELSKDRGWDANYAKLVEYHRQYGNCLVPSRDPSTGAISSLGKWVSAQRRNYRVGILSLDKINALNALDFEWQQVRNLGHADEEAFQENLHKWRTYNAAKAGRRRGGSRPLEDASNGPCRMPKGLSHWIRQQHKLRAVGRLAPGRERRLQDAGFFAAPRAVKRRPLKAPPLDDDSVFDAALSLYRSHLQATGKPPPVLLRTPVVYGHNRTHPVSLGQWVKAMRDRRNDLAPDKITKLQAAGFVFNTHEHIFDNFLRQLKAFKQVHGHLAVPRKYPGGLGEAVSRTIKQRAKLHPNRIKTLNDLDFPWTAQERYAQRSAVERS